MKLIIHKCGEAARMKSTLTKGGKLYISTEAALKIDLEANPRLFVATADTEDGCLYLLPEKESQEAYKVTKTGSASYINIRALLDRLGINYPATYDVKEFEYEGKQIFRLVRKKTAAEAVVQKQYVNHV